MWKVDVYSNSFLLFQPRDCIIERSPENDNYFSSSSCPKYVSLPVYTSLGKFLLCLRYYYHLAVDALRTMV